LTTIKEKAIDTLILSPGIDYDNIQWMSIEEEEERDGEKKNILD